MMVDRDKSLYERLSEVQYNNQNVVGEDFKSPNSVGENFNSPVQSLKITTYGVNNKPVLVQEISNIKYAESLDNNRYTDRLNYERMKANELDTKGFVTNVTALESSIQPPSKVAKEFTIIVGDGLKPSLTTKIEYKNVEWKIDLVKAFEATMIDDKGNVSQWKITSELMDNNKIGKLNVEVIFKSPNTVGENFNSPNNEEMKSFDWDRTSGITLQEFTNSVVENFNSPNPLNIFGSSSLQIGDSKVSYLSMNSDELGKLQAIYNDKNETFSEKVENTVNKILDKAGEYISKAGDRIKGIFRFSSDDGNVGGGLKPCPTNRNDSIINDTYEKYTSDLLENRE